jgi:DNA-binding transcriptional regulator YiaG
VFKITARRSNMNKTKKRDSQIGFSYLNARPSGEQVRKLREDAKLTRHEFACILRVSLEAVTSWEIKRAAMSAPLWYMINKIGVAELKRDYMAECNKVRAALEGHNENAG